MEVSKLLLLCLFFSFTLQQGLTQGFTRQSYHDPEKKNLKEVFQVKDTILNVLHGHYESYYLNGSIESKGQFTNNETTGIWEFYYETGKLKMRGILRQNSNYGLWEYFNESGQKSMEGTINGKNREGEWKSYYEDGQLKDIGNYKANKRIGVWKTYFEEGILKAEGEYVDDIGTITEYYHSGKIQGQGPKSGTKNNGHWHFFSDDGALQNEGNYTNGKKNGEWVNYFHNGKIYSRGKYEYDEPVGKWEYYFDNGVLSSTGEFSNGQKGGYWGVFNADGSLKSEITYTNGEGLYQEYYPSGKLKVKGKIINDKREGKWDFFYEDGKREGECEYVKGKGTYNGYYPNGNQQTNGQLEEDVKVGTWEIYELDGKLSGYYRPFYEDKKLVKEISELVSKSYIKKAPLLKKRFTYFDPRFNEFKGVIIGGNPILAFTGRIPLGIEFYMQQRLGHEFEFIGIRDPFFVSDDKIALGKEYARGYSISIKQKFYNPLWAGLWYFGHEIRFTNLGYFTNIPIAIAQNPHDFFTISAVEQRIEWGILLGYRIMQSSRAKGFTIDVFGSVDVGYRGFNVEPAFASNFADINHSGFSNTFHCGLNLGHIFSFSK